MGERSHLERLPDHVRGLCKLLARQTGQPVQLHETHLSWVLVCGDEAFKLRKRIGLPFVDFRRPEARRDDCLKEVALNSRWAPELYLGVVEIRGCDLNPSLGGSAGPLIDWAVRMKRLPDGALLKHRIDASRVEPRDMHPLADVVAEMHRQAPVVAETAAAESRRLAETSFAGVLDQLRARVTDSSDARMLECIGTWVDAQWSRCAALMQKRADHGFVRDCHGDLHLENVAWVEGVWRPFDGIEFDEGLRQVDVISDLAFLTMDLKVHGRPDLAFALLDAYLQHTGDHEGVKLLRLYEVQRALVRLLVAGLPGAHCEASLSRDYLTFAARAVQSSCEERLHLVLMHGLSGSGKSVLSGELASCLPAIRARSDVERKRLFGLQALDDSRAAGQRIYTKQAHRRTASRMLQCAKWALQGGWSFVADATFLRRSDRDRFRRLAERMGCELCIVHCEVDMEGLHRRLRERAATGHDASEATEAVLIRQLSRIEPMDREEKACTLTVCTARPIGPTQMAAICAGIKEPAVR